MGGWVVLVGGWGGIGGSINSTDQDAHSGTPNSSNLRGKLTLAASTPPRPPDPQASETPNQPTTQPNPTHTAPHLIHIAHHHGLSEHAAHQPRQMRGQRAGVGGGGGDDGLVLLHSPAAVVEEHLGGLVEWMDGLVRNLQSATSKVEPAPNPLHPPTHYTHPPTQTQPSPVQPPDQATTTHSHPACTAPTGRADQT